MSDTTAAPEGTLDDAAAGPDEVDGAALDDLPRLVQFSLAEQRYLVPVEAVQEVLVASRPTRLPGSAAAIVGVTSVRGRIVAVVDPRPVLDPSAGPGAAERLLVVGTPDGPVALLVDRVDAVLPADVAPAPTGPDAPPPFTIGHAAVDGVDLSVIDVPAVIAAAVADPSSTGDAPGAEPGGGR